jgi:hypothetical protein
MPGGNFRNERGKGAKGAPGRPDKTVFSSGIFSQSISDGLKQNKIWTWQQEEEVGLGEEEAERM